MRGEPGGELGFVASCSCDLRYALEPERRSGNVRGSLHRLRRMILAN
jgi:hypothetical protein